jgi:outer membrane protein OmpA-like peptidoglycan-associated protein
MKGAVAAAVVIALLPYAGQAQSWFTPGPTLGGFYVGLESGTTWFLNNNGYSMNTGWTTGAFVGYEFPLGIRAEFSGSYRANTGTGPGQVPTLVDKTTTTTTPTITTPATTTPATTTPPTVIPGTTTCVVVSEQIICTTSPDTIIPGITIPGTTIPGQTIPGTTTTTTTTTQITQPGTVTGTIQQMTYMVSGYVDLLPGAIIVPYVGAGAGMAFISDGVASCGMCSTQFAYQSTVGVGFNVNDNLRFDIETRYYGTTSPGPYNNNNITTTVRARYRLNQRRDDDQQRRRQDDNQQAAVLGSKLMVFFDWDSVALSPQAVGTIRQAAGLYKANSNARITTTGHTDRSGPESYNMALSLRRANVIKDELVRDGVPAQAIVVIGAGESRPLAPTGDGVREAQNRRVEIVVQ